MSGRANFALGVDFRKLLQHLADTGHPRVALELSACQQMDSTFLGVLAHAASQRAVPDGDRSEPGLELWNPGPNLRELIEDLGVAHLSRIVDRDAAAETHSSPAIGFRVIVEATQEDLKKQ